MGRRGGGRARAARRLDGALAPAGDVGVDAIALVAIVGALALGEYLAAAIVALMMSGGAALEAWADGRARRELRLLVERAPRIAHRYAASAVEEVPVEELVRR